MNKAFGGIFAFRGTEGNSLHFNDIVVLYRSSVILIGALEVLLDSLFNNMAIFAVIGCAKDFFPLNITYLSAISVHLFHWGWDKILHVVQCTSTPNLYGKVHGLVCGWLGVLWRTGRWKGCARTNCYGITPDLHFLRNEDPTIDMALLFCSHSLVKIEWELCSIPGVSASLVYPGRECDSGVSM